MDLRAFCEAAPDGRHSVEEGDHHGPGVICLWCDEHVFLEQGRFVTAPNAETKRE